MKKILIRFFLIVSIILIFAKTSLYILEYRDRIVFIYMLYDHIEYNGKDYYMASLNDQSLSFSGSEIRGPVYLVYKDSKINWEPHNFAIVYTGYEGEEEEIYLHFDSAIYIRGDYQTSNSNQ